MLARKYGQNEHTLQHSANQQVAKTQRSTFIIYPPDRVAIAIVSRHEKIVTTRRKDPFRHAFRPQSQNKKMVFATKNHLKPRENSRGDGRASVIFS